MSLTLRTRLAALAFLVALSGCSADGIYGPQKFFPGSNRHSWSDCGKFGTAGADVQVCAGYTYPPGGTDLTPRSYVISYFIPNAEHVRIAVFDSRGAFVKTLLDRDELGVIPGQNWPTVTWDFTDGGSRRVPPGDYRVYFRAGDFVSSSDVEVP